MNLTGPSVNGTLIPLPTYATVQRAIEDRRRAKAVHVTMAAWPKICKQNRSSSYARRMPLVPEHHATASTTSRNIRNAAQESWL